MLDFPCTGRDELRQVTWRHTSHGAPGISFCRSRASFGEEQEVARSACRPVHFLRLGHFFVSLFFTRLMECRLAGAFSVGQAAGKEGTVHRGWAGEAVTAAVAETTRTAPQSDPRLCRSPTSALRGQDSSLK